MIYSVFWVGSWENPSVTLYRQHKHLHGILDLMINEIYSHL